MSTGNQGLRGRGTSQLASWHPLQRIHSNQRGSAMEASRTNSPVGQPERHHTVGDRYAQIALISSLSILGIMIAYFLGLYLLAH